MMAFPRTFVSPLELAAVPAVLPGLLAICLIGVAASAPRAFAADGTPMVPASIHAAPGLQCKLHPASGAASDSIPVYPDSDGYARFFAVKGKAGEVASQFALDCVDAAGKSGSYVVDLASDETFVPHPLDLSKEPGKDRPPLSGDPLGFTQEQLIHAGYGLRPGHDKDPAAYARWLAAAMTRGRILEARHPSLHEHKVTTALGEASGGAFWVGSVLTGAPNYISVEATFNVPTPIGGGDQTGSTSVSVWDGVGGYGLNGLIQTGIDMSTTSTAAGYGMFREYAGGDPDNDFRNGLHYGGTFTPSAGDVIYAQSWYCNADGAPALDGGYGCTHLVDQTSGAVFDCTSSTGSPCWAVKALPLCSVAPLNKLCFTLGQSAEFIMENEKGASVPFTDFTPKVTMAGSAFSSTTNSNSQTVSSDSSVTLLMDGTNSSTHMVVTLGSTDQTYFSIEPGQPSYGFYCQGPLKTTTGLPPLTRFKWAAQGAGAKPPGQGECAWADRGPRGTEIKSGDSNDIKGYLNAQADLATGKFMELGVYNDPASENDMVVKQPPKFVTPPFPSNPAP